MGLGSKYEGRSGVLTLSKFCPKKYSLLLKKRFGVSSALRPLVKVDGILFVLFVMGDCAGLIRGDCMRMWMCGEGSLTVFVGSV